MKFGKHIQSQQVPGWSSFYLDYKFLKKIISSLAANRPASEAASLALGLRPADVLNQGDFGGTTTPSQGVLPRPPLISTTGYDEDRGPDFQAHKAAFFFKLERELEKINGFYLQKEASLKLRLETLLSKRRAAAARGVPKEEEDGDVPQNHFEWSAVEEGFRLLERDLVKLQQFIEINGTGFRKILKKWDKRSKSSTKELYLARQVDVQPVFNRQLISELSDTVAACLLDLTDLTTGLHFEGRAAYDVFVQQVLSERIRHAGPFRDFENNLRKAVAIDDRNTILEVLRFSDSLSQHSGGTSNIMRILWRIIVDSPPEVSDFILLSLTTPLDFSSVDDVNSRTCLHEVAISGNLRLVDLCLERGSDVGRGDAYGRSPLHYASMNGHADVCRRLLKAGSHPNTFDLDNYTPLIYATLKGCVECVKVLIEEGGVAPHPITPVGDLIPLLLASQAGHVDVVLLLLRHGATCVPNSNGEYPMHLAAREGHAEVCKVLLHQDGWDTRDKYHEWTPLFHAARNGHASCIQVLLDEGCAVDLFDELGHHASHYAAWYGHHDAVQLLLDATNKTYSSADFSTVLELKRSPVLDIRKYETEIDLIPSLSLPPPIMPHRVYGHNYLDRNYLVQVSLGHCSPQFDETARRLPVQLHQRLLGSVFGDKFLMASAPLKLVMTSSPDVSSAPYSIPLALRQEREAFSFQTRSMKNLTLEFSIYPSFGTKTIGRAIAIPSSFDNVEEVSQFILPILDNRLHVIGEAAFEVNIVKPFEGVTLEVGGNVETYWKSTSVSNKELPAKLTTSRWPVSAQTSPSTFSVPNSVGRTLTVSSLVGTSVYIVLQVTRDFHPVVYADWLLPETTVDVSVGDVTLEQFEAMSERYGRNQSSGPVDWSSFVSRCMLPLPKLLTLIPATVGLHFELAYPCRAVRKRLHITHHLGVNNFVDSVLRTIYQSLTHTGRKIVFTSFVPEVCAAVNWKQPNYPVFFSSQCGKKSGCVPSRTAIGTEDERDIRMESIGAAVDFSKQNNLLGVFVDIELLFQIPSLIQQVRDKGLLVGVFGHSSLATPTIGSIVTINNDQVDAFIQDGTVFYVEHELV